MKFYEIRLKLIQLIILKIKYLVFTTTKKHYFIKIFKKFSLTHIRILNYLKYKNYFYILFFYNSKYI